MWNGLRIRPPERKVVVCCNVAAVAAMNCNIDRDWCSYQRDDWMVYSLYDE